jgi:hypothetical protein
MKNTMQFYISGLTGSPSLRSFGINYLIYYELLKNKSVKIYAIFIKKIKTDITGLFKNYNIEIGISLHTIENKCCEEYKDIYKKYPDWNFQENKKEFPKKN